MKKFDFFLDLFIKFDLTNSGDEIYEVKWDYLISFLLLIWSSFSFRFLTNVLIVLFLEPQMVLWNPLITRLRNLFLTYEIAKKSIAKLTWLFIAIFFVMHF